MSPNNRISKKKQEEIENLSERFNKGYVAKRVGVSRDTVTKYVRKKEMRSIDEVI